jgi:hypothetical protein
MDARLCTSELWYEEASSKDAVLHRDEAQKINREMAGRWLGFRSQFGFAWCADEILVKQPYVERTINAFYDYDFRLRPVGWQCDSDLVAGQGPSRESVCARHLDCISTSRYGGSGLGSSKQTRTAGAGPSRSV